MSDQQEPTSNQPTTPVVAEAAITAVVGVAGAVCTCSAASDLVALKGKTSNWKKIVKGQLDEAQSKNAALREEAAKLNDKIQTVASDTRLQLTTEFRDRLSIKDDEMGHYKKEYEKLKQELLKATRAHTEQLGQARIEGKSQYEALQLETLTIQGNLRKEMELEGKLREGMKRRITELEEKNKTLVEQLTEMSDKMNATMAPRIKEDGATSDDLVGGAGGDSATTTAISAANAAAISSGGANSELELMVTYLQDREQQLVATVTLKEEQCLTLQATLRSLRNEVEDLQVVIANHGETQAAGEEKHSLRLSKLTSELLHKHEELSTLQGDNTALRSEVSLLQNRLEELRTEATVREAAFDEWYQSEQGEKGALIKLEQNLKGALSQNERLSAANELLETEIQDLHLESDELKKDMRSKSQQLDLAEKNMTAKLERLRVQEERVRIKQQELSDQAAHILGRIGGDGGEAPNKNSNLSSSTPSGGIGGSSLAGSGGALLSDYSFISALQEQYRTVLTTHRGGASHSQLFQRYKRWLPVMIVCLFLLMIMFWMREGNSTNAAGSTLGKLTDTDAALAALRREYGALLTRCGPPAAGSKPSPTTTENTGG